MAEQVTMWKDSTGKLHETEALADAADHDNVVEEYLSKCIRVRGECHADFDAQELKAMIIAEPLKLEFLISWLRVFLPPSDDIPF